MLNSQVLVLNRLWQAVNICSARRAFSLVYAGQAQIVSSDNANNFSTHDFESWRDLSANAPDHEVVTTISCHATVAGRRLGKTWFAPASHAIPARAIGFRVKHT